MSVSARCARYTSSMRQAERFSAGSAALPLPEEDQLEAEAFAFRAAQVARVIPPLGAKVGMLEVIARKCVAVTRERGPVFETRRRPAAQGDARLAQPEIADHSGLAMPARDAAVRARRSTRTFGRA